MFQAACAAEAAGAHASMEHAVCFVFQAADANAYGGGPSRRRRRPNRCQPLPQARPASGSHKLRFLDPDADSHDRLVYGID